MYQKARTLSVRKNLAGMLTLNVSLLATNNCNKTRLSITETTHLKYCHHVSVNPLCSKELKSQNYQSMLMFWSFWTICTCLKCSLFSQIC